MRRGVAEGLFWTAIGFVAVSFVFGGAGIELSSGRSAELLLQWHKAFGLLSLVFWLAAVVASVYSKRRFSAPLSFWAVRFRGPILALIYILLILQPISGWLLASLEGKLTSIFGWTLPALTSPGRAIAEYVLAYHVVSAGVILIFAAWSLRLIWEAYALGGLIRLRRRQLARERQSKKPI